jgi:hypothetical protein
MPLRASARPHAGESTSEALAALIGSVKDGDYFAITAYLPMTERNVASLTRLRGKLRDALGVATTVGFGPRFLHSTGQLHKGGPATGVFLQLTADPAESIAIPGMVDFGTLQRAQALGDFQSLDQRARRGLRLHLRAESANSLDRLERAVDEAIALALGSGVR